MRLDNGSPEPRLQNDVLASLGDEGLPRGAESQAVRKVQSRAKGNERQASLLEIARDCGQGSASEVDPAHEAVEDVGDQETSRRERTRP